MTSRRLRLFGAAVRPVARFVMARAYDPVAERRRFARMAWLGFRAPKGMRPVEEPRFVRGGEPALWLGESGPGVILHLHGGGYILGTPRTHWKIAGHIARAAARRVFLPHYRLAPEHPMTDLLADARAGWDFLVARGHPPGAIAIGGDSAGGGLALSLLASLLDEGIRPACVYLWSPFADQSFSGPAVTEFGDVDHYFPGDRVHVLPELILRDIAPTDPRVSPLFADFPDPPPTLIQASRCEILRSDATRVAEKLEAAGGDVTLELQADAPHVWQLFHGWFPEADEAVARTGAFVRRHLGG